MAYTTSCQHEEALIKGDLKSLHLLPEPGDDKPASSRQSYFLKDDAMLFVINGAALCRHGGTHRVLDQHQFVFFKKGVLLELLPAKENTQLLFIVLKRELALQFATLYRKDAQGAASDSPVIWAEPDAVLIDLCHGLADRLRSGELIPEPLARIKLLELLFQLSMSHPAIVAQVMDCRERPIPDIPAIVEEKLMDDVPLPQLARLTGRSLSSFRRDFLAIYNMAPSRWIRQRKLEKARQLLMNTNMTVTDVCYTMGFQSNAHFSRIFKSYFGYPPSDIRRPVIMEKGVNLSDNFGRVYDEAKAAYCRGPIHRSE